MKNFNKKHLEKIKNAALSYANYCGGCEECSRAFGPNGWDYDAETTYVLVEMIEKRGKLIKKLLKKLENAKKQQKFT